MARTRERILILNLSVVDKVKSSNEEDEEEEHGKEEGRDRLYTA